MLHLDLNRVLAHDRHTRLVTDAVNCRLTVQQRPAAPLLAIRIALSVR